MGQVMKNLIVIIIAVFSVSACSTYPSKFKCGEAKGLGCHRLSDIDKQITSGEIEQIYLKQVYLNKNSKKCRGLFCKKSSADSDLPALSQGKAIRVKMQGSDEYIWLEE